MARPAGKRRFSSKNAGQLPDRSRNRLRARLHLRLALRRGRRPSSSLQFGECGPTTPSGNSLLLEHEFKVDGNKLIWTIPYKMLPKEVGLNKVWDAPVSYTTLTEPVVGYGTADFVPETAIDYATGDGFKLS